MTSIEEHERTVREFEEDINEKIRRNILLKRQKIIGFSASEAATNLFAILLHKLNLIDPGFNVNHIFFASKKKAENIFNLDFPNKEKILNLLVRQEELRNLLCYGREKEEEYVKEAVENFYKLKKFIQESVQENV